ncbi:MAG: hypothetical protein LLF92_09375 [Planctomycetaceae bacterium]|nr:hypothetical protein [Planctomycetaceae bacterium]
MINIENSRQLFIDDYLIEKSSGVSFGINPPIKTYEKCVIAEKPWEDVMVGPYGTVMDDSGDYRMWYESYSKAEDGKALGFLCYAQSKDGKNWEKPKIGKIPFNDSVENNIVFPHPGKLYHGGTVFKDLTADDAHRYKLVYAIGGDGLFGAYSPDGINWSTYDTHLLKHQCDTQNVCFWDSRIKKYVAYVRHNVPIRNPNVIRTVGRSETSDFMNWPVVETVLTFDKDDPSDMDMYNSAAVKYARADDVYIIITSCYHHNEDVLIPQLAVSRDGIAWKRIERKPFIELGKDNAFDRAMIHTCVGQIIKDNEIWIYYRGIEMKHNQPYALTEFGGTISRAILRIDGFVSANAGLQEGSILTKQLKFSGSRMEINCQTEQDGFLKIKIESGRQCVESEVLTGNMIDKNINLDAKKLSALSDTPVKITFKMKNAKLYSFCFKS